MDTATRTVTFRLYPSRRQEAVLAAWLELHRELYNAALAERRDAYRKAGVSLSYRDQQNELPAVKQGRPDLIPLGSHALQETVRRVDRAFRGFFRRLKAGKTPGYPRFKSRRRFASFGYPDPAGWQLVEPEGKSRRGRLRITNLGTISLRGKARVGLAVGEPRTLTVQRRNGRWYATVAVRYATAALRRNCYRPAVAVGLDVGCRSLVATSDGAHVAHPKFLGCAATKLAAAQRALSRKTRGSRRREKARARVAQCHERVARQRHEFQHQLSDALVRSHGLVAVEDLDLANLTRSAKGTVEAPGRRVRQKAGLNRTLLDAAHGRFVALLESKAAEAGTRVVRVDPRGTSQRCSACGETVPKSLAERWHRCSCGYESDRDTNAARNILLLGLTQAGWEPPEAWRGQQPPARETASMPLAA